MITIKKIHVPIDLSSVSAPALGYACSLAKDHHAEVIQDQVPVCEENSRE